MRKNLGVRLDSIAVLRGGPPGRTPDPVEAAAVAERSGAGSIAVHLRGDRRYIQERDVRILRETVKTQLNLQMPPTNEMLKVAFDTKPDLCTLVPDRTDETTSETGLDLNHQRDQVKKFVGQLREADLRVALFIEPELDTVKAAHRVDATAVELNSVKYTEARGDGERRTELRRIIDAARTASKLGMRVSAGRGLDYHTIQDLSPIEEIEEYLVGHSIVARAVIVGLESAVRDMAALLED